MHVAGKPVELCDNEGGAAATAQLQSLGQLRAVVVALAALDLLQLGKQGSASDKLHYRLASRVES